MVFFGDHDSQVRKRPLTEEEEIPLFIAAPGLATGRSDRLGSHLDLGPTVLDLLGLEGPDGWLGTSLSAPGPGRVLFNDPTRIDVVDGNVRSRRAPDKMAFMLTSARLLDP